MSFGGLSDGRSGALPYGKAAMTTGELSPPEFISQRLPKPSFVSPGLSLGLVKKTDPCIMLRLVGFRS